MSRLYFFCVVIFLFFSLPLKSEKSLEEKLKEITEKETNIINQKSSNLKEIMQYAEKIEYGKNIEKVLNNELIKTNRIIGEQTREIEEISNKIIELNNLIEDIQDKIGVLNTKIESQKIIFSKRIRALYKEYKKYNTLKNLIVILDSKSASEFSKRVKSVAMISENDRRIMENIFFTITELKANHQKLRNNLEEKNKLIENNKSNIENLKVSKTKKNLELIDIYNDRVKFQEQINQKNTQMRIIEVSINNLIDEKRKTQELIKINSLTFSKKKGKLPWPLVKNNNNKIITKYIEIDKKYGFKMINDGIEIKCKDNQEILCVSDGSVVFSGWIDSFGWTVMVSHGGDYITMYSHLNSINVKEGLKIKTFQVIGKAGDTGSVLDTSLFFQIRSGKNSVDPELWLAK